MSRPRPASAGPRGRSDPDAFLSVERGMYYNPFGAQHVQQLTRLSQVKAAPKWTMGTSGRRGGYDVASTPGPGSYLSEKECRRAPSYGFGTAPRDNSKGFAVIPGPGAYRPQARPRSATPQCSFGTSQRGSSSWGGTPGPGAYSPNMNRIRQNFPQYSATPRRGTYGRSSEVTPGPGAYQAGAKVEVDGTPGFGFGTAPRENNFIAYGPGPGAYNPSTGRQGLGGPAYSMRFRNSCAAQQSETPGPGAHGGLSTQFGY